jgi:hypothetical protein
MYVMMARQFSGANVEILNFTWNYEQSNLLDRPVDGRVDCKDGCE